MKQNAITYKGKKSLILEIGDQWDSDAYVLDIGNFRLAINKTQDGFCLRRAKDGIILLDASCLNMRGRRQKGRYSISKKFTEFKESGLFYEFKIR